PIRSILRENARPKTPIMPPPLPPLANTDQPECLGYHKSGRLNSGYRQRDVRRYLVDTAPTPFPSADTAPPRQRGRRRSCRLGPDGLASAIPSGPDVTRAPTAVIVASPPEASSARRCR